MENKEKKFAKPKRQGCQTSKPAIRTELSDLMKNIKGENNEI